MLATYRLVINVSYSIWNKTRIANSIQKSITNFGYRSYQILSGTLAYGTDMTTTTLNHHRLQHIVSKCKWSYNMYGRWCGCGMLQPRPSIGIAQRNAEATTMSDKYTRPEQFIRVSVVICTSGWLHGRPQLHNCETGPVVGITREQSALLWVQWVRKRMGFLISVQSDSDKHISNI